jgi:hypothetical protein
VMGCLFRPDFSWVEKKITDFVVQTTAISPWGMPMSGSALGSGLEKSLFP